MRRFVTVVPKVSLSLLAACVASHARAEQASALSSIRVTSSATVTANPDRAYIDVGVVTQTPQSQTAVSQNAVRLDGVLKSLRKALGANADIKTASFSLNPDYQYHANGTQPTISGYTATNIVRVTLDELGKIGTVIDTATSSGANQVPTIQFALKDEQTVHTQALRDAAVKARAEAEALAGALGLKVNRILTVEEGGPAGPPVREVMLARTEAKSATPIEPGGIQVGATVTLTVEVTAR